MPTAVVMDGRTLQSTPESGGRAGFDGHKMKRGSKVHVAVDTSGHLLALVFTPADAQELAQVAALAAEVQAVCGKSVRLSFVDQGYSRQYQSGDTVSWWTCAILFRELVVVTMSTLSKTQDAFTG